MSGSLVCWYSFAAIPPPEPIVKPACSAKREVGADAQPQNHQIRLHGLTALQLDPGGRIAVIGQDPFDPVAHVHGHAVAAQGIVQGLGDLGVHQRQDLRLQLRQGHLKSLADQLLDHLQSDVAGADHHRAFRAAAVRRRLDAVRVRHVSQGEYVGRVAAGQRGHQGRSARREDQLVIRQVVGFSAGMIQHRHRLGSAIDAPDFLPRPHVDAKAAGQELRRGDQQLLPLGDLAADVVRQTAVGERNVLVLFQQDDLRVLVHAAGASRRRSAAGDAADDDDGRNRLGAHGSSFLRSPARRTRNLRAPGWICALCRSIR